MTLLASRLEIAKQIGQQKALANLPVKNFQVEQQVIQRARTHAIQQHLNPDTVQQIFNLVIRDSVNSQLDITYSAKSSEQHCLVVGGAGKMGNWLAHYFLSIGKKVSIVDPNANTSNLHVVEKLDALPPSLNSYDIIVVATPLHTIRGVLQAVIEKQPRGLVFDVASLKTPVADLIQAASKDGLNIGSIHPMFGPNTISLTDHTLLICKTHPITDNQILDLFKDTAVQIQFPSFDQHDELMSISLGLSHFVNLLIGSTLLHGSHTFEEILPFASTTFLKQMQTTSEVFSEDAMLYYSIQYLNPFRDTLQTTFKESLDSIIGLISQSDPAPFIQFMNAGHDYFFAEELDE